MVKYIVEVITGNILLAGTFDNIFIKLFGTAGESKRTHLKGGFSQGSKSLHHVSCPKSLGSLVLVQLDKHPLLLFPPDKWFCCKVAVTTPEGDTVHFPCYRWVVNKEAVSLRDSKAKKIFEDQHPLVIYYRSKELQGRELDYCWSQSEEGLPGSMKADDIHELPPEVRFSFTKTTEFLFTASAALVELSLKGLTYCKEPWSSLEDISQVFCCNTTSASDYVKDNWMEDWFFGYQFLNGCNPMMIRRCSVLPSNFPVTCEMVRPFLKTGTSLKKQMLKGNIFLCNYKHLDGVATNVINGKQQYQAAPLCLLYRDVKNKLMPIAIQLKQQPGELNPIFLPSDSEYDWLLAKIFVRGAEFSLHELNSHLLRTHLLAEVFAVATLRRLPMVHPLYKLLIPHTRYTLQINYLARHQLLSEDGVITQFSAVGGKGMFEILRAEMSLMTYSSLCLPEDIKERGLESVPDFYYRDDGLKLWDIINRFVRGILNFYYRSDSEVQKDTELQTWIGDIFTKGFLGQAQTGIPKSFASVEEVIKFVTMVIFTASAQHSAVNSGQYDYGGWMPNAPISLQLPPPTRKGFSDECTMLKTLPDINTTVHSMATLWLLSKQSTDFVPLGSYPEDHFTEVTPCKLIAKLQVDLKSLSKAIKVRNAKLQVPYTYLCPEGMENSVAI